MSVIFLIVGGYLFINDNITMGELIIFPTNTPGVSKISVKGIFIVKR